MLVACIAPTRSRWTFELPKFLCTQLLRLTDSISLPYPTDFYDLPLAPLIHHTPPQATVWGNATGGTPPNETCSPRSPLRQLVYMSQPHSSLRGTVPSLPAPNLRKQLSSGAWR
jgi:hypothetical protein